MTSKSNAAALDKLFDPVSQCLTQDVARRLTNIRASAEVQDRLGDLADKSSDGTLSAEERSEYESYVRGINFIGILQAKVRALLTSDAPH